MIVLGIDPGTASTGWGVIEQDGNRLRSLGHGCIVTSAKTETPLRLRQIHDEILSLIGRFHPAVVALEELFVNVNVKTALAVGQARGAIILAAGERDLVTADVPISHGRWKDPRIQNQHVNAQPFEDAFQEERLWTFSVEGDHQ